MGLGDAPRQGSRHEEDARLDPGFLTPADDIVTARVKPGSRKGPLVEVGADGSLTIYVAERAVDGKANAAVIELLADYLGMPKSRVELVAGAKARVKRFRVLR